MLAENNTERTEQWKIEEYQENINIINYMLKKYNNIDVKNRSLDIKVEDKLYKLIRLNDAQFYLLYKNGIAISDDYAHLMMLSRDDSIIYSSFAKMYITLKSLFGESGRHYYDWKGSFSFPFLICFKKGEELIGYLMNVYNSRSTIDIFPK